MRIVILAAGVGSRLGRPIPKPMTVLSDGRSILQRQIDALSRRLPNAPITVVVGFKKDMVMEAHPTVSFAYNERFGETNTSKSLLRGLAQTGSDDVMWLNGDVVFDEGLLDLLVDPIGEATSFVAVNHAATGDEEVKYDLDDTGHIRRLSKQVSPALGEAVGINFVAAADKETLMARLDECDDDDYFERGIELGIESDGMRFRAVEVTDWLCIEVDFAEDLARVNSAIAEGGASG